MAKLEDFIRNYLSNKKIANYREWVEAYGEETEEAYAEDLRNADAAYRRGKAEYGSQAASLMDRGLSQSGYREYLDGVAYAGKQTAKIRAESEKRRKETANRKGYAAYLTQKTAEAEQEASATEKQSEAAKEAYSKTVTNAFLRLVSQKIEDTRLAEAFLTNLGVDEETARSLAEMSKEIGFNTTSKVSAAIRYAIENYYRYDTAYKYAKAQGMTDEVAKKVAQAAQSAVNGYYATLKNQNSYR
ncbi:MAG: hypothetical protein MJ078_01435 [Clostridia bacterium]|nr:hypothetical protein [Clostridia bacterium]